MAETLPGWGAPLPRHPGRVWKSREGHNEGSPAIRALYVESPRRVFVGHGDGDSNDGSTLLVSLDPTTGEWTDHGIVESEGLYDFRRVGGAVWALLTDPTTPWNAWTPPAATYPPRPLGLAQGVVHAFDALEHAGAVWVGGSTDGGGGREAAAVWRSPSADGSAPFTRMVLPSPPADVARVYTLSVTDGGELRARVLGPPDGDGWWTLRSGAWSWDGGSALAPAPPAQVPPWAVPRGAVVALAGDVWVMGTPAGDIYTARTPPRQLVAGVDESGRLTSPTILAQIAAIARREVDARLSSSP